jgi:hypothetical protein
VVGGNCLDPWPPFLDYNTHRLSVVLFIFLFSGTEGAGADVWLEGGSGGRELPGSVARGLLS